MDDQERPWERAEREQRQKQRSDRERITELEATLAGIEVKLARDQDVDGAMRIVLSVKQRS